MAQKAKKAAKKPAVDSRGRRIGGRATRQPPRAGLIQISSEERTLLRDIANRAVESNTTSAFARAMALDVGEWDVARGGAVQSLAMSLSQARKRGELKGRKFEYGTTTAVFKTSDRDDGSKYANVLWIIRTK